MIAANTGFRLSPIVRVSSNLLVNRYLAIGNACPLWVIESLDTATDPFVGFLKNLFNIHRRICNLFRPLIETRYDFIRTAYGLTPFMINNRISVTIPRVIDVLTKPRQAEAANLPVGVAGFCWGGQHTRLPTWRQNRPALAKLLSMSFSKHTHPLCHFQWTLQGSRGRSR